MAYNYSPRAKLPEVKWRQLTDANGNPIIGDLLTDRLLDASVRTDDPALADLLREASERLLD